MVGSTLDQVGRKQELLLIQLHFGVLEGDKHSIGGGDDEEKEVSWIEDRRQPEEAIGRAQSSSHRVASSSFLRLDLSVLLFFAQFAFSFLFSLFFFDILRATNAQTVLGKHTRKGVGGGHE